MTQKNVFDVPNKLTLTNEPNSNIVVVDIEVDAPNFNIALICKNTIGKIVWNVGK